jgi:CRISPR/Cas system-associated endonuclease/helicase Cas3
MATGGAQLPLDPNIVEAIEEFRRERAKIIRVTTLAVLAEDLKKEIEQALKDAGEI